MGLMVILTMSLLAVAKEADPTKVLGELLRPPEALPTDCSVAALYNALLPARTNPYVSADDTPFVGAIAMFMALDPKHVRAAGSTVYRQKEEVGVYAVYLVESVADLEATGVLKKEAVSSAYGAVFKRGHVLVLLWRDQGAPDSCFASVRRRLQEQLTKVGE